MSDLRVPSRLTRDQIIWSAVMGVLLVAFIVVPGVVRHGLSTWQWVLLPVLVIGTVAGQMWGQRRANRELDAEDARRRGRRHAYAKSR